MTSSSEGLVLRGERAGTATPLRTPDLRSGGWTRFGNAGVLGDAVTERTLDDLADRTRAAAEAQGYAVGWAQGKREAQAAEARATAEREARTRQDEARRHAEHTAALTGLREAAAALRSATDAVVSHVEEAASELACDLTAEILGVAAAAVTPADVVRRVLALVPTGPLATVRLNPSVCRAAASADLPASVTLRADASLGPADAVVELEDHVLDLRVDQALARVREVLA
jgi:flagellar assembly protein FliH